MTVLNKIIYRLRLKLRDTDSVVYSKYEVLDALNETMGELSSTVTQFYTHLNFAIPNISVGPDAIGLTENDETGWPSAFDVLIIEYALILLSPGDYGTKEQAKILWKEKVLSLASSMSRENNLIKGCYGTRSIRHIKRINH